MLPTVLSILVIAGAALFWGAWALHRRGAPKKRILLMVLVAALLFANVAIWTVPMADGNSPAEKISE